MLMASHHKNWALRGPDFAQLRPDCALLYRAAGSDVPAQHDDLVWIAALHALGNGRIVAIGHAEFHGHRRPELCPAQRYMACWWNALVPLHSDDGGRSFRRAPAPAAVAAVPYAYQSGSGRPVGYFQPSNIVRHEGHAYFYFFAEPFGAQRRGNCLLRNADPADPAGWRAWDGESFSRDLSRGAAATEADVCAPVPSAASTITGILRHAPSGGFLAVIAARRKDPRDGVEKRGVWSMWTRDLIHFGTPQLLIELPLMFAFGCEEKEVFAYPALIDPASGSPDFDSMETGADLYLTRFRPQDCKLPMARDLLRAKVRVAPQ